MSLKLVRTEDIKTRQQQGSSNRNLTRACFLVRRDGGKLPLQEEARPYGDACAAKAYQQPPFNCCIEAEIASSPSTSLFLCWRSIGTTWSDSTSRARWANRTPSSMEGDHEQKDQDHHAEGGDLGTFWGKDAQHPSSQLYFEKWLCS